MERSESRILTTHAGALPRPDALLALNAQLADGSNPTLIDRRFLTFMQTSIARCLVAVRVR